MIRRKWGALLLLWVAPHTDTTASGDDGFSLPNHVRQAIVQIDNRGHGGGSGTYLGAGYVLTCDHLFRDSRTGQNEVGRVVVSFPTGQASTATLLQQHRVWDLALLKLDAPPPGVAPIDLATDYPQPGETVISCGYGRDGQFYGNVGQVTGYGRDKYLATPLADTMLLTGAARGGDSGGPILNRQGQLVGVLWGSDGRTVVGTQVGQCRRILDQWQCLPAARPQVRPAPRLSGGTTSPPAASSPVPDATQQQLSALQDELARLRQQLDQLQRSGPVGPPGPPGPAGPRGPQGPQGPSAEIDLPRLADAVRREIAGSIRVKVEPVR